MAWIDCTMEDLDLEDLGIGRTFETLTPAGPQRFVLIAGWPGEVTLRACDGSGLVTIDVEDFDECYRMVEA